jgi:hypothetical protein
LVFIGMVMTTPGPITAADPWAAFNNIDTTKAETAKVQLESILLEHPGFYPAHFNLGTVLMPTDRDTAATHLETATASPSITLQHDAWYNLALTRFGQGRLEESMNAAAKALNLQPKNEETTKLRDELRRVALIRANEARLKAEAEAKKLKLLSTTLPDGHVGEPYDQRLQARGGAGQYRYALGAPPAATPAPSGTTPAPTPTPTTPPPAVALPPGMNLDADGRLHGLPKTAGRHDLPIVVNDSADANVHGVVTWVIQPAPAIITTTLPEAIVGSPYEATIDSVGLQNPKWTVTGLPAGIIASSQPGAQVRLSGIPTTAGTVTLSLRADDGVRHAIGSLSLTASDTFAPDVAVLPPATAWAAYAHQLGVRGAPQAYRWTSVGAGGITCKADGQVIGTPEQAGSISLPVTIHAADGRERHHLVTIPVNPPPVIDEATPIAIHTKQAINRPLKVTGGTPPYQWTVHQGLMPPGLRLDPDGVVRGAATEIGDVTLTVALEDRWKARTQSEITFTITKRPDDEQKDEQKDQQKKEEDKQQQKDQQQQDQNKDQQQQADQNKPQDQPQGEQKDQQKDQQQAQNKQHDQGQQNQPSADQQKSGADQKEQAEQKAEQAAQRAQVLNQAAADRWLDNLPKEDRDVLRYQLLDGGQLKPRQDGKTW